MPPDAPGDAIALAVIVCRFGQYAAASVLMGSALFFVYALPAQGPGSAAALRWSRPLLACAALGLAAATALGLIAQTAVLAGSLNDALTAEALSAVVGEMDLGQAALIRSVLALAAAVFAFAAPRGRARWLGAGGLGTRPVASVGWRGPGAATHGAGHALHLAADVVHALAAALWVGALAAFAGLVFDRRQDLTRLSATARALQRFSPLGIALVATLAVTGLVNAWFLVGTDVTAALRHPYGRLLALKLVLFAGMLVLAALHRQRSVPALAGRISAGVLPDGDALVSLRRSVGAEALLGFAVLALVAWFGTLPPPGAM
jgi:putative copper resistance protein D